MKTIHSSGLLKCVLIMVTSLFFAAMPASALEQFTFYHDGEERVFLLHTPPLSTRLTGMQPLIFVLHGRGGTARNINMLTRFQFNHLADRDGFWVAYPEGIGKAWNDGREDAASKAHRREIDDVGFLQSLAAHLIANYSIDPDRIFAAGFSNGGMMCYLLANNMENLKGIATVGANFPLDLIDNWTMAYDGALIMFNGTEDSQMPFDGGCLGFLDNVGGCVLSAQATIDMFLDTNQCGDQAFATEMPDVADDGTKVIKIEHPDCPPESGVSLYVIEGGGHTWPGGRPMWWNGRTCEDINARDEIWGVFKSLGQQVVR